ncbi:hypothetical protein B0H15DRAFT_933244 [Mycena belliarum]|uniref:Uncharacterized protein n=1 Tax=Mycena belliarum TaxID=1033014 RepID=A0AAD6XLZ1_9AGAR|nr:hypothetical protein B0H15DRAFT_933244 [Mycena belliae]
MNGLQVIARGDIDLVAGPWQLETFRQRIPVLTPPSASLKMSRLLALTVLALGVHYAIADTETSIIVPFADPQAISADMLGVDSAKGRTTWALRQGAYTGTWTDPQGSFPATATLVEGADYASFTYVIPEGTDAGDIAVTAGGECSLAKGVAVCVAVAGGTTVTATDPVTAFGVQIAGTSVAAAPTGGASSKASGNPASGGNAAAPTKGAATRARASFGLLAALFAAVHLA